MIAWKLPAFNPRAAVCQAVGRKSPFLGLRPLSTGAAFFLRGSSLTLHDSDGIDAFC